jgi:hypothetical protein
MCVRVTLKNMLGISLDAIQPVAAAVGKRLAAAQRNSADAQLAGLRAENRFDVTCTAIVRRATARALQAHALVSLKANRRGLLRG